MLRKITLGMSALGTVVVCFVLYTAVTRRGTSPQAQAPEVPAPAVSEEVRESLLKQAQEPAVRMEDRIGGTLRVPGGERPEITWYDPTTHRPRMVFRSQEYYPLSDTEIAIVRPVIRLISRAGQTVELTAREGRLFVNTPNLSEAEIKRGTLSGEVVVLVDRRSESWREAHPELAELASRPEDAIRVWLEGLSFDLELGQISSDGPVRVEAREIEMSGRGLSARWNQRTGRVERLVIERDVRLGAYDDRMLAALDSEGAGAAASEDEGEAPDAGGTSRSGGAAEGKSARPEVAGGGQAGPAVAARTDEAGDPILEIPASAEREVSLAKRYAAEFRGEVRVEQVDGQAVTGRVEAPHRLVVRFAGGEDGVFGGGGDEARPEEEGAEAERTLRLRLSCAGPLVIAPEEPVAEDSEGRVEPDNASRGVEVVAEGEADRPVVLTSADGRAVCERLVYRHGTREAWLYAGRPDGVRVDFGEGRWLEGPAVYLDRGRGVAEVHGAGRIVERGNEQDGLTEARWRERLVVHFADTSNGEKADSGRSLVMLPGSARLTRALLVGEASLSDGEQRLRANELALRFGGGGAAGERGRLEEQLEHVEARGQVVLVGPERRVQCDEMTVEFGMAEGRVGPRVATLVGQVRAREGEAAFRASEKMVLHLRPVEEGADGGAPDGAGSGSRWDLGGNLAVVALDAWGDVRGSDPQREVALDAAELHVEIPDGRRIERGTALGQERRPAFVQRRDMQIVGARIELSEGGRVVEVPGRGRLRYESTQDLDGTVLSAPVPVAARWSQRMRYDARAGRATMAGDVRMNTGRIPERSRSYDLAADRVEVEFEVLAEPPSEPAWREAVDFWVFAPLVKAGERGQEEVWPEVPSQGRRRMRRAVAAGNVIALLTRYDARGDTMVGRAQLTGPAMTVDFDDRWLWVRGGGTLLIEDYPLDVQTAAGRQAPERGSNLLVGLRREGPSQTLFVWQNAMSYLAARNLALFDGDVEMIHRAGSAVLLGEQLAASRGQSVAGMERLGGRATHLVCDNLLAAFARQAGGESSVLSPEGAALEHLQATGTVQIIDGSRTFQGHRLTYSGESQTVHIYSFPGGEAYIHDEDPHDGTVRSVAAREIRWDLMRDEIEVTDGRVVSSR